MLAAADFFIDAQPGQVSRAKAARLRARLTRLLPAYKRRRLARTELERMEHQRAAAAGRFNTGLQLLAAWDATEELAQ